MLILLGTFVLEDAATILAAMDVQVQQVSLVVAMVALYVGIILGDLGLYGLGRLAVATPLARRWAPPERFAHSREDLIEQIGVTLLHEVGHLLGLDEDELYARGLD